MNTNYFDTRTQARNAVEALNGKFKDFGADAPKGKRWAVISEAVNVKLEEVPAEEIKGIPVPVQNNNPDIKNEIALLKASIAVPDYVAVVVQKPAETAKNGKGKNVPVLFKKSVTIQPAA